MAAIDLLMKTAIVLRSGGGGQTTKQPGVEVIVLLVEGIRPIDPPPRQTETTAHRQRSRSDIAALCSFLQVIPGAAWPACGAVTLPRSPVTCAAVDND